MIGRIMSTTSSASPTATANATADRRFDHNLAGIDRALQDDFKNLAQCDVRGNRGSHAFLEQDVGPGHCELANLNERSRAGIECRALAHADNLEIEPQLGEVLVKPVALGKAALERCWLQILEWGLPSWAAPRQW